MAESPLCEYCNELETIEHLLLVCPAYQTQRQLLKAVFTHRNIEFNMTNVLCFGDFPVTVLQEQLGALAAFLSKTGRVSQF